MNFFYKIIIFILFLIAFPAQAANLYFDSSNTDIQTGKFVEFDLLIDTQDEYINAIEGEIIFPSNLLTLVETRTSNSIINFWLEEAKAISKNRLRFAGITPGGYLGEARVLKLIFKADNSGQGKLSLDNFLVLLNDGQGTETRINTNDISFNISDSVFNDEDVIIVDISDQDPPEPFTPVITKIEEIGGDKYLLIFVTQDKGSGIDYYQVKEGYRPFIEVESPYVLKNQSLDKKIIVKAVDKSGNERKITISPVYSSPWYQNVKFFVIIIIIIVLYSLRKVKWRKIKRK